MLKRILMGLITCGLCAAHAAKKPNIIVIFTDDHGYADIGIHGQADDVRTPHIDALAKSGVLCADGYITAPQCCPSRAGIMTGKYQQRFGFGHNGEGPLPLDEVTLADRMKQAGYRTGMVGKWHLSPNWTCSKWMKDELGIDHAKAATPIPFEKLESYYPGNRGFSEFFKGELNRYWTNYGLDGKDRTARGEWMNVPGYRLEIQTDAALSFIDRNKENPFFLYLAYFAPHVPLEATEKYLARFPGEMPERRRYALAMISAMDDGVGRIRDQLKNLGLDKDTLIFFIADNGAPLKIEMKDIPISFKGGAWDGSLNTPWVGEKGMLMEGGLHVPYLVSWPGGLPSGKVYSDPVISLDVAATCLAVAGQPIPAELDGENLIPLLNGKKSRERALFWRFWNQAAVRKGKWKYLYLSDGRECLYDLESERHEKDNLISQYPEKAKELRKMLEDWADGLEPKGMPSEMINGQEKLWFGHYLHLGE